MKVQPASLEERHARDEQEDRKRKQRQSLGYRALPRAQDEEDDATEHMKPAHACALKEPRCAHDAATNVAHPQRDTDRQDDHDAQGYERNLLRLRHLLNRRDDAG